MVQVREVFVPPVDRWPHFCLTGGQRKEKHWTFGQQEGFAIDDEIAAISSKGEATKRFLFHRPY